MPRFVALLRAINVGGHTVTMARLRVLFEELDLTGVETVLASGNVLCDSSTRAGATLERRIAAHLEDSLGYEVATFVRTPAELAKVTASRAWRGTPPGSTLYVGFMGRPVPPPAATRLRGLGSDIDSFLIEGREVYWRCRKSMGLSQVTGAAIERALGQPVTLRKSTTVEKLASRPN